MGRGDFVIDNDINCHIMTSYGWMKIATPRLGISKVGGVRYQTGDPPIHGRNLNHTTNCPLSCESSDINPFATGDAYMPQLFHCLQWYAGSERVKVIWWIIRWLFWCSYFQGDLSVYSGLLFDAIYLFGQAIQYATREGKDLSYYKMGIAEFFHTDYKYTAGLCQCDIYSHCPIFHYGYW